MVTWSAADFDGDSSILLASVLCQSEFFNSAVHFAGRLFTASLLLELRLSRCIGAFQLYGQGAGNYTVVASVGA